MAERHLTAEGGTHPLPTPFIVVATQNPIEHHGTYPLPESQLDRFMLRLRIGDPSAEDEAKDSTRIQSFSRHNLLLLVKNEVPTEALQVDNDNLSDVQTLHEYLAAHDAINEKLDALKN